MACALERGDVDFGRAPQHVAMTCDGNRRYAIAHGCTMREGYEAGLKTLFQIIRWVLVDHGSRVFSLNYMPYSITVDARPRARRRATAVWEAVEKYFRSEHISLFHNDRIRFRILGEKQALPDYVLGPLSDLESSTRDYSSGVFYFGVAYSHWREVLSAARPFDGRMDDVASFAEHLWVQDPVDLFFRPGGVHVRGDFLLLQSVHARIFFSDVLWPDLTRRDIDELYDLYAQHNAEHGRTGAITQQAFP